MTIPYLILVVAGSNEESSFVSSEYPGASALRVLITITGLYLSVFEGMQLYRRKLNYFRDFWNIFNLLQLVCTEIVLIEQGT